MIKFIFRQTRAIHLLFFVIVILGILSFQQLGTAELPEPPGTGLLVNAILPGASPEEVDEKVARLMQSAIQSISGVDEVTSRSGEAFMSMRVKFIDDQSNEGALVREITQVINQVQDLPPDLEGPFITRPSNRIFPAMTLIFQGGDDIQRHNAWHAITSMLMNIEQVEHVQTLGDRERRIDISIKPLKLQQFSVRLDTLSSKIQNAITDRAAGRIETLLSMSRIRVLAKPDGVQSLKDLPININGTILPLHQLAEIKEVLSEQKVQVDYRGKEAWYINIYRRKNTKIQDLSETIQQLVKQSNLEFEQKGQDLKLIILQDRNFVVERVLGELGSAILLGMLLVLLVLFCFFGLHHAVYAALGIPFSFLVTFIAMDIMDISLNTFTLFGLVLVCGMIVDDAIMVLENIVSKLEQGLPKAQAIEHGMLEVFPAVLAATGTTIAAFLPLLLMTGGMGDFVSQIPKVAILALIASLAECFIMLPAHIYSKRKNKTNVADYKSKLANRAMAITSQHFAAYVGKLLLIPYRILGVFVIALSATSAFAYYTLDFTLFDADEVRSINVHLSFPKTTDLALTSQLLDANREQLLSVPMVKDIVILNGWNDINYSQQMRSHFAKVEIYLTTEGFAQKRAQQIADTAQNILEQLPGLQHIQLVQTKNKPPVSSPVNIYLYGNDKQTLTEANARVIAKLSSIASIKNILDPLQDGIPEKVFHVDKTMAAHYNLQPAEISQLLYHSITGQKIGKLDSGDEVIDIYVKQQYSIDWRDNATNHLILKSGEVIALEQLGHFSTQLAPDAIKRSQGRRYIAITADIDSSIMSNFKTHREIERLVTPNLLPAGVSFEQLGEYSDTQKSLTSIIQSAVLSLGLVYLILTILFRSYLQPLMVLLTIPLAYMGVIWGMALLGRDISLFGLVGIVGLIGIVVNDSLVWVSCYNRHRRQHNGKNAMSSIEAATKAISERFRPIMLTTITTVLGLLPVALSQSAGIAGSMASTIVSGLICASTLLLIFLPICVVIIDGISMKANSNKRFSN
jgi:multidrug efflux pump subunit AcrB